MNSKIAMVAIAGLLVGGIAVTVMKSGSGSGTAKNMSVNGHMTPEGQVFAPQDVKQPAFNLTEKRGEAAFNETCAACHGENAAGTEQGPTFLNRVYVPSHHGDQSFFYAAQKGVSQHHWSFGDMPAQPQVSIGNMKAIVAYVRAIQNANGFGN